VSREGREWLDFNAVDASTLGQKGTLYIRTTLKEHAYIVDPEYSPKAGRLVRATGSTDLLLAPVSVFIPLPVSARANGKL
jgi:hypothetical protein